MYRSHRPLVVLVQSVAAMTMVVAAPMDRWRLTVTGRRFIQLNTSAATRFRSSFWVFFGYTKMLSRTEMRTRERKNRQFMRTF